MRDAVRVAQYGEGPGGRRDGRRGGAREPAGGGGAGHPEAPPSMRPMLQPMTAEPSAMAANSTPERRSGWRVRTPLKTPTPSSVATDNPQTAASVALPGGRGDGTNGRGAPVTEEGNMSRTG